MPLPGTSTRASEKQRLPASSGSVPRKRLFARLDSARSGARAIWVSGPPGSGKTTLLASWIRTRRLRAAWLRCDEGDGEFGVFLGELAAAAARLDRRAASLAPPSPSPGDDPTVLARRFLRALFAVLPARSAIVLDSVDASGLGPHVVAALRAAVEEAPEGLFLAIAARSAPPPSLARLRVHGPLTTLSGEELAATPEEALALSRRQRRPLGRARIEPIRRECQGWMAGLVLGLSNGAATAAATNRQDAADYFTGEILDRIAPLERRLLLEVALLDSPSSEELEAATGSARAGSVLRALAHRGLFVHVREDRAARFELHPLFHRFLLAHGPRELPPGRADEVRRAAAARLADGGPCDADRALALLAEVPGAEPELAALLKREASRFLVEGRARELNGWLARLPRPRIEDDPWLTLWEAAARTATDPAAAVAAADRVQERFERDGDAAGVWIAWATATEAILYAWADFSDLPRRLGLFERLHDRFPFPSEEVRCRATLVALFAFGHHAPSHPLAETTAESARRLVLSAAPAPLRLVAGAYAMLYYDWWHGAFERTHPIVDAVGPLAREPGADAAAAILWMTMESLHAAAMGDEAAAARCADEARALARSSGVHAWDMVLNVQGLWRAFRTDDMACARRHLSATRGHARPGLGTDLAMIRMYEALIALRTGETETALARADETLEHADRTGYTIPAVLAALLHVRAHTLLGNAPAADHALLDARARLGGLRSPCFDQVLALLEAAYDLRFGRSPTAALARALSHGGAGLAHAGYLLSPAELATLLASALEARVEVATALELVKSHSLPAPPAAGAEWPRELRVRLLGPFSAERTGRELAATPRAPQKPLELLRALVALGGRGVSDAVLSEALWPEADGDAAHHALETTLYRLRRMVGPRVLVQRGGQVSIDRDRCWVDTMELEERLARLARAAAERPPDAAELERLVDLLRGPAFAQDGERPWAVAGRRRLRRGLARALDALTAAWPDDRAVGLLLERVDEVDPLALSSRLRSRHAEQGRQRASADVA